MTSVFGSELVKMYSFGTKETNLSIACACSSIAVVQHDRENISEVVQPQFVVKGIWEDQHEREE
jgi:hypothetical protein